MRGKIGGIFAAVVLGAVLFFSLVYAGNDLNFEVPVPENSKLLDSKQLRLGSRQIDTKLYESQETVAAAVKYYKDFFRQQDFKEIFDQIDTKTSRRLLRYKKDAQVVSFSFTLKDARTQIVVAKYLQGAGELSPEETKPSVKDSIFAFPDSDVEGVDIPNVPRPSPSVRLMSQKMDSTETVMYTTPLDIASVVDFYRQRMPDYGWEILSQTKADDATQAYLKASGEKSLGIESPFSDGENMEQVIKDSYFLTFTVGSENVEITIFPNFTSRELGSIVQIAYSLKE